MIFSLPFEVWSQIFEFLDETLSIWDGRTTLALASQTSRYLHAIIEPILYSRICIVLHPSFAFTLSCIPFINSKPRLAEAVRQLMIDGFSKNHIDEFSPGIDAAMSYHLHEVCRLIPRMTGLRKLTCNKTLYFPSLHSAVVSHPTLSVVTILSPRLVLPSHLRSPEQINYLSNLAVQHTAKVNSSYLQSFETNSSPIMRALSTSGAAANIRYATITICSEQDRLSISALLEQCVSLHHLRFIGLEHATRLCKTTLPNLRKFQGHPRDAVNLVPGRPVTELELFPTSDTPSWVTYGITCVTDAIAAAALSSIPLQYLSITLYDVREVTFHAIQGLFPNLLKLRVVFLNINPSPVETIKSIMRSAIYTIVQSFKQLSQFTMYYNCLDYSQVDCTWESSWVKELARRCPSLRSVCLHPHQTWTLSSGEFRRAAPPQAKRDENVMPLQFLRRGRRTAEHEFELQNGPVRQPNARLRRSRSS